MSGEPEAVEYVGKVRDRDRDTSWEAASLQTNGKCAAMQVRIYNTLRALGPMTDEELLIKLGGDQYTVKGKTSGVTRSGLATRRHELHVAGWVTPDLELDPEARAAARIVYRVRKRRTLAGSLATVWRAVTDDEPAPPAPDPDEVPAAAKWSHEAGLAVAQRFAQWEIGDRVWADRIIHAYLNPAEVGAHLDEEQA